MHARRTIRESVGSLLRSSSITGTRVFENRLYPVQEKELPCLLVITEGDRSENITSSNNPQQQRNVRVLIRAIVKSSRELDDEMDDICAQVETAIAGASFSFRAQRQYIGTENRESIIGNQPTGEATLFYEFTVRTKENDPQTIV